MLIIEYALRKRQERIQREEESVQREKERLKKRKNQINECLTKKLENILEEKIDGGYLQKDFKGNYFVKAELKNVNNDIYYSSNREEIRKSLAQIFPIFRVSVTHFYDSFHSVDQNICATLSYYQKK